MINKYYIWGVVILVICILLFFFFSPPFSLYKNIDTNIFANYGNFIAGLLGSMIALFAAILFYKALKHQIDYSKKGNFENNYIFMLKNLNKEIDSLYFEEIIKQTNGYSIGSEDIRIPHEGISVLKYLSKRYLVIYNDKTKTFNPNISENLKLINDKFNEIKKQNHSQFNQLFKVINYIFEFIQKNRDDNIDKKFYFDYLNIQIPEYLKFIIAIYRRHEPEMEIINNLIDYYVISPDDFKNYIDEDKHEEFIKSLNLPIRKIEK
ncbi:MAG: hypothetical protein A2X61_17035 [Ignavibacteria bacterium GWB2_35_12]|nr:MAG: hypothetical protein A2X63_07765 [Ignavibacteria bacterium GWA2_35_8]OGU38055.1 MAG: hypothetical protein A2X61_17035 [Ignavibacteria bacterium GWB2_35_12]OGU95185.1 MAG: hypothetical protein A2220_03315 [Ignavibacteria bacterium RIFOXYA2_FULL_35_10]OGV25023.1 MAG: hypothetical protein A2475_16590 [Ignavibacteria bacterium RIFOXYC2_FULL_35_21]